jgi:hypothetical protein
MFKLTKKKVAAGALAAGLVAMTGVGYAYWTSDGNGTGSVTTGTDVAWEVTTDAATGDALSPDGPIQNVVINVKNNNSGTQRLQQLDVSVANSDGSPWDGAGTCSADDFKVGTAAAGDTFSITGLTDDITAGDTNSDHNVDIQMIDTGANQDDCRGLTVPLYVVAS